MKGSIRMVLGFLVCFGAVGHMDADPSASLLTTSLVALLGLIFMASGVRAMNRNNPMK